MISLCSFQAFMNINDPETEEYVIRKLGDTESVMDEGRHPLVGRGELSGPKWRDHFVCFKRNALPMRVRKIPAHAIPVLKGVMDLGCLEHDPVAKHASLLTPMET